MNKEKIYYCPSCNQKLWSFNDLVDLKRKFFNSSPSVINILTDYASGRKRFPETYQYICLNDAGHCERLEHPIDKLLLEIIDRSVKPNESSRNRKGQFKS